MQSEYPRKDYTRHDKIIPKTCYLSKLLEDPNQETWQQLLQPDLKCYEDKMTKDTNLYQHRQRLVNRNYSREDVIKILQPYLFDPLHQTSSVITVLPVHVYYDNYELQKPNKQYSKKNFTGTPMQECVNSNKARWVSPENVKSKLK